jgi:hypothetical protein
MEKNERLPYRDEASESTQDRLARVRRCGRHLERVEGSGLPHDQVRERAAGIDGYDYR